MRQRIAVTLTLLAGITLAVPVLRAAEPTGPPAPAPAPAGAVYITGRVMDKGSGKPLADVTVALYDPKQQAAPLVDPGNANAPRKEEDVIRLPLRLSEQAVPPVVTTRTLGNGTFTLKAPGPGHYILAIQDRPLYGLLHKEIDVPANGLQIPDLALQQGMAGDMAGLPPGAVGAEVMQNWFNVLQKMQPGGAEAAGNDAYQKLFLNLGAPLDALRKRLNQPVAVTLHDATVAQAAQALSQASGVPISVDPAVTTDQRLTLDAQGVSLARVLETIAQQADLMIAPDPDTQALKNGLRAEGNVRIETPAKPGAPNAPQFEIHTDAADGAITITTPDGKVITRQLEITNGGTQLPVLGNLPLAGPLFQLGQRTGVVLKPWPMLEVNGKKTVERGANAPWSDDWGVPPSVQTAVRFNGLYGKADGGAVTPAPTSGLALTSMGDHTLVVAQPGVGDDGKPGVWLAVFHLDGDQLKLASTTFQPLGRALAGENGSTLPFAALNDRLQEKK